MPALSGHPVIFDPSTPVSWLRLLPENKHDMRHMRPYISSMPDKVFYVYIFAKARNSTFYVGVTSDLAKRSWQHKNDVADGFTKKYGIKNLVYYEIFSDPENAIRREKRLKKWSRAWKMQLIEKMNPDWKDLYEKICR